MRFKYADFSWIFNKKVSKFSRGAQPGAAQSYIINRTKRDDLPHNSRCARTSVPISGTASRGKLTSKVTANPTRPTFIRLSSILGWSWETWKVGIRRKTQEMEKAGGEAMGRMG